MKNKKELMGYKSELHVDEDIQKLVDMGISGTDIMHGELKSLILNAEEQCLKYQKMEEDTNLEDAFGSLERKYWEGMLDAYGNLDLLTYQLAFAINERNKK
jgi:hypothetical protein